MISQAQIAEVLRRIVDGVRPAKVILSGSYAYSHLDEDSDLDLLVVKDMDTLRYRRGAQVKRHLQGSDLLGSRMT